MPKKIITYIIFILVSSQINAQQASIVESGAWFDSVYVKWQAQEGIDSFHVYLNGEEYNDLKIDDPLIRNYGSYYRADVPGLHPGIYSLRVVPIISNSEGEATSSPSLVVENHDRSGFAFSNNRVPGAYNVDGSPKDNAVILYITENTKNTISLEVTGANSNPCVGLQNILDGFKKGKDTRPLIIRLVGQITDPEYLNKGDIVIENDLNPNSSITFEGIGNDAVADGWGIRIKNAANVEIRNIGTMNTNSDEGDNIGLQQNNEYIWVHHCDFFYGNAGGDSDQAKGDGALDCKRSTYVTFSYNHFWDSGKCNLLGLSEESTEGLFITYHHNWYDHSDSRHPRVRYYSAHVYNNYYDGNAKYGVGATNGSSVFVEANYFRNCKYPILISMQGSDVWDESTQSNDYSDMPTFSKEDGGSIKAFNNYMSGQKRFVPYGSSSFPNPTVDFDAFVADNRNDEMSNTIVSYRGAYAYNNFDTNSEIMYAYTPDSPQEAKEKVVNFAGRTNGGDFQWSFNNEVDDVLYDVNSALKNALNSYKTSLVSIQGDGKVTNGNGNGNEGGGTAEDRVHNFTESGKTSTFYNISGNLSDSKGTVIYNGLTLKQCLKIESSTNISFTTSQEAILTLVFNDNFSGEIKINGERHSATAGILVLTIPAGDYQITKGDVANLYYMSIEYTTAIKDMDDAELVLYPNPVKNTLFVSHTTQIEKIELYTSMGSLIRTEANSRNIDVSHLHSGSYLVKIITPDGIFKRTIVKN